MINPRVDFPGKQLWQTQLRPQTVILKMYGQYRLPYLDGSLEYLERRAQRRADRFRLTTSGGGGRGQSGEMDRTTCVGSPLLWAAYYHLDTGYKQGQEFQKKVILKVCSQEEH